MDYDESFGALLPRLFLAYEVTDDLTVGASYGLEISGD